MKPEYRYRITVRYLSDGHIDTVMSNAELLPGTRHTFGDFTFDVVSVDYI